MAMNNRFRSFGSISKVEDQDDGTIMVYGVASTGARDAVNELITPEAMKAALPDYSKFPALREMHQPSAAGRVTEAYVDDDGATQIAAHVVDPVAITKVKTGVYAGFSIGGKVTSRDTADRTIIKGLRLTEISLVDVPCNPEATLNMWKADMPNPTSEETIAKAKELAHAAGRKNYKNFLFAARQELIAKAEAEAAAELGDEGEEGETGTAEGGAEAPAAAPETGANAGVEGAAESGTEAAQASAEDDADKSAPADPVSALGAALSDALAKAEKAAETRTVAIVGPFDDLAKAAAALRIIGARADDDLAKGMYSVSRLADVIDSACSVQNSMTWESEREGDNSPVPAKLAQAIADLGVVLIAAAQEEVAEIVASYSQLGMDIDFDPAGTGDDGAVIQLAAGIVDLVKADADLIAKAGARNSKADATKIQAIHDHAASLGATCASGGDDGAEKAAALAAENDRLTKALADAAPQVEDLAKRFNETIDSLRGEVSTLTKRLETVENTPAAPKTATNLVAISKGYDAAGTTGATGAAAPAPLMSSEDFRKAFAELPEAEQGQILLKVALNNPLAVGIGASARR